MCTINEGTSNEGTRLFISIEIRIAKFIDIKIEKLSIYQADPISNKFSWGPRFNPIATMSYGDPELTPLRRCLMGTPGDGASLNLKIKRSNSEHIFN